MWSARWEGDFIVVRGKDCAELIEGVIETLAGRIIEGEDRKTEVFIGPIRRK